MAPDLRSRVVQNLPTTNSTAKAMIYLQSVLFSSISSKSCRKSTAESGLRISEVGNLLLIRNRTVIVKRDHVERYSEQLRLE